jgi:hypothetical protein
MQMYEACCLAKNTVKQQLTGFLILSEAEDEQKKLF